MGRTERLRQACGLFSEEQPAIRRKPRLGIVLRGLGGGQPEVILCLRVLSKKRIQVLIVRNVHQMPVIQARTLHGPVGNIKAKGADQVQAAAGGSAGPGNIAGVLRDLRLHQHDIQHGVPSPPFWNAPLIVMHSCRKFNRKMVFFAEKFCIHRFYPGYGCDFSYL